MPSSAILIHHLSPVDVALMEAVSTMFGEAFEEAETYTGARPSRAYLLDLLGSREFVALAALDGVEVVGAIAAYELRKFEQERSEIYLYDLAVAATHRRRGIATDLTEELRTIAASRGAHVVFVQADAGDVPPIALYSKLGTPEDVLHFDIPVDAVGPADVEPRKPPGGSAEQPAQRAGSGRKD